MISGDDSSGWEMNLIGLFLLYIYMEIFTHTYTDCVLSLARIPLLI